MTIDDLIAQREQLEAQIAEVKAIKRKEAKSHIARLMAEYGITAADLGGKPRQEGKKSRAKAPVKYSDGSNAWSGRGITPLWLKAHLDTGATRDQFLAQ